MPVKIESFERWSEAEFEELRRRKARDANPALTQLLDAADVVPTTRARAQRAGELLARTQTSDSVDALVVAVAAERGDLVLTSDPHDLQRLADDLPTVRIAAI